MLRCRPSEITLAPSDIAYCKHRFALQQAAQRDRSAKITDVQASTSPRIRRGPQRSRDDAVIHPHGRLAQRYKSGPSRLRPGNPVGNLDGAGETCSFPSSPAASVEDFLVGERCHGQFIENYDSTVENGLGRLLRIPKGYSYAFSNSDLQTHNADQCITEESDDDSALEFSLSSTRKRLPKSVVEKIIKEDKFKHQRFHRDDSLKQISAEMPGHTLYLPTPVMTRTRSFRTRPDDMVIEKQIFPPQLDPIRRPRDINDIGNFKAEKDVHRKYEQSTSYAMSIKACDQMEPSRNGMNPALTVTPTDLEGDYDLSRANKSIFNQRRSHRLQSLNKYEFLSHSAHDLTAFKPRQWGTTSFKSHHNLGNFLGLATYESAILQEQGLGHSYRSSSHASSHKQCPFSSFSSRRSSYASTSQMYGPPQDIPARRSSLDTVNVLNVSCYGRSCSCSSPGLINAITDNYPSMPKSPKLNRNQSRDRRSESLPSGKYWTGFTSRSSFISEASPETVIHECSPLDHIQHCYARIHRGCENIMHSRWRFSLPEPDQNLLQSDRHIREPQRLFSDPMYASGAFPIEGKRDRIRSNDVVSLSSPSELSVPKCRNRNLEKSMGDGSSHEREPVFRKMPATNKLCRPASEAETSLPSDSEEQYYHSREGQQSSCLTLSSLPPEPSSNLVRNGGISQVAGTETETTIEHDLPIQRSEGFTAESSNSEINISSHSANTNTTNNGSRINSISTASDTSQATQSLPWHLSDAHLQQENRSDEDEQQMRMALQRIHLRTAGNDHGDRMDETPPREGRIESYLRA